MLNDPSTPYLSRTVCIPPSPRILPFIVQGLDDHRNQVKKQSANVQVCLSRVNRMFVMNLTDDISSRIKWVAKKPLVIAPRAGRDLNAFYDRESLQFLFAKIKGREVFTCESTDVVAHEMGHALLDCIRSDIFSVQSLEMWAYHEAFADLTSIALHWSNFQMLQHAFQETKGNFLKSNVISRLAESIGRAVFDAAGEHASSPFYLRDAVKEFKYVPPTSLPKEGRRDQLVAEEHSFGRVYTNAVYRCWVALADHFNKDGRPLAAASKAGRIIHRALIRSSLAVPRTANFLHAAAALFLAELGDDQQIIDICRQVLSDWNLLPKTKLLQSVDETDLEYMGTTASGMAISIQDDKIRDVPLGNFVIQSLSAEQKNIVCEIPNQKMVLFDPTTKSPLYVVSNENQSESVQLAVSKSINSDEWMVNDGKLVKRLIH